MTLYRFRRVVRRPGDGYPHGMQACIPNIGPKQRRRRLRFGWMALAAAALVAIAFEMANAPLAARALVAFPVYASMLGFFQYREKT